MAGGTFLTKNKVRPGAYVNIAAEAKTSGSISDSGLTLRVHGGQCLGVSVSLGCNTYSN